MLSIFCALAAQQKKIKITGRIFSIFFVWCKDVKIMPALLSPGILNVKVPGQDAAGTSSIR